MNSINSWIARLALWVVRHHESLNNLAAIFILIVIYGLMQLADNT